MAVKSTAEASIFERALLDSPDSSISILLCSSKDLTDFLHFALVDFIPDWRYHASLRRQIESGNTLDLLAGCLSASAATRPGSAHFRLDSFASSNPIRCGLPLSTLFDSHSILLQIRVDDGSIMRELR